MTLTGERGLAQEPPNFKMLSKLWYIRSILTPQEKEKKLIQVKFGIQVSAMGLLLLSNLALVG